MWTAERGRSALDEKSADGFWITFAWVIAFIIVAQVLWLMAHTGSRTLLDLPAIPIVISVSMLIVIAAFQQFKASKVTPLCYSAPMMNIIILQAILMLGVPSGAGLVPLMVFLSAANGLLLALAWEDVSSLSASGISELWMSITPVACLVMLGSAAFVTSMRIVSDNAVHAFSYLIWSAIWLGAATAVMVMFLVKGRRRILPPANWPVPMILFVVTAITVTAGPFWVLLTGLNLSVIFVVVTLGLVEFAAASSDLEALLRNALGEKAATLAFITGYMLSFICVLLAWLVIMPGLFI